MTSYRFCRPDDLPRLVRALNECFVPHVPGLALLTEDDFRREIRELGVWPSNCMVAVEGDHPVAVLVAAKRPLEVLIRRIAVRPGCEGRGHGSHLLTSLSQKLAVLGPPHLVVEVPQSDPRLHAFFTRLGYRDDGAVYTDYLRPQRSERPVPEGLVLPVRAAELLEHGGVEVHAEAPWERSQESLEGSADRLGGLAVVSGERVEACLLHRSPLQAGAGEDILAVAVRESPQETLLLELLVRDLAGRSGGALRLVKLAPGEMGRWDLAGLGFHAGDRYDRLRTHAAPG